MRDAPSRAPAVVGPLSTPGREGPVVGLIIKHTPGNRPPSPFPPDATGYQRAGNTNHPDLSGRSKLLVCTIDLECTLRGGRSQMYTLALPVYTYTHPFKHTYIHTYIHVYIHVYMYTYIHTCMHTHTHTQTDIHEIQITS